LTVLAAALGAMVLVATAGGDEDAGGPAVSRAGAAPRVLSIEVGGSSRRTTLTAPVSVPKGLTRIRVRTTAKRTIAGVQLVRFGAGHTADEALAGVEAWSSEAKPLPAGIHLAGGVTGLETRSSGVSTQVLAAGRYVAFAVDTDAETKAGSAGEPAAAFTVTAGRGGGELPAPAARITMTEYAFATSGLAAGRQRVRVANLGTEPHFVVGLPLKPGKTKADARRYFAPRAGEPPAPPPVDFKRQLNTAILDGGSRQVVDLKLTRGSYVLLCFVPDRTGGAVHASKGMISAVKVR